MSDCKHQFKFLRQEKRNEGYEHNPRWIYSDVFFCEKCLAYERRPVKVTVPAVDHFGETEVYDARCPRV